MSSESLLRWLQRKLTLFLYKTRTLVQGKHGRVSEATSTVLALSCPKVNIGSIRQYLLTLSIMNTVRKQKQGLVAFCCSQVDWHLPVEIKNFTEL